MVGAARIELATPAMSAHRSGTQIPQIQAIFCPRLDLNRSRIQPYLKRPTRMAGSAVSLCGKCGERCPNLIAGIRSYQERLNTSVSRASPTFSPAWVKEVSWMRTRCRRASSPKDCLAAIPSRDSSSAAMRNPLATRTSLDGIPKPASSWLTVRDGFVDAYPAVIDQSPAWSHSTPAVLSLVDGRLVGESRRYGVR